MDDNISEWFQLSALFGNDYISIRGSAINMSDVEGFCISDAQLYFPSGHDIV